jgi:hypothetical protein
MFSSTLSCNKYAASAPLQVLELVLQNSDTEFAADEICSLLCSSKAIRRAAQQASGPCSSISLTGSTRHWGVVSRLASFAKWLPAHANLAGTLALELDLENTDEFVEDDREQNVLDTILALSVGQQVPPAAAAAAAAQAVEHRWQTTTTSSSSSRASGRRLPCAASAAAAIMALTFFPRYQQLHLHTLPGTRISRRLRSGGKQQWQAHWPISPIYGGWTW